MTADKATRKSMARQTMKKFKQSTAGKRIKKAAKKHIKAEERRVNASQDPITGPGYRAQRKAENIERGKKRQKTF